MLPEIATLEDRMARGGHWMTFRDEIADLYGRATTQEEYLALLRAHEVLGRLIDKAFDGDAAKEIKEVHRGEYLSFLNKEACEGGDRINPAMLAYIAEREVELGRLAPDDEFRTFASAGGSAFGDTSSLAGKPSRPGNKLALLFALSAGVFWIASVRPFGISALWLILLGLVLGTAANSLEAARLKRDGHAARRLRGYGMN